jgi:hypothetical protein
MSVESLNCVNVDSFRKVTRRSMNPKMALNTNCTVKLFFFIKTAGIWDPPMKLTTASPYTKTINCLTSLLGGVIGDRRMTLSTTLI